MTFPATGFDKYEIIINDGFSTDGYLELGQVFLDLAYVPSANFSRGITLEYDDGIELSRTDGGSLRAEGLADGFRTMIINLDWLNASDRTELIKQMAEPGRAIDIFVSAYPGDADEDLESQFQFVAKRTNKLRLGNRIKNYRNSQIVLSEV